MHIPKIAVVTGSRAEFGLLSWFIRELQKYPEQFQNVVFATGSHYSKNHGETYKEILKEGFEITDKVELPLEGDDPVAISKALAVSVSGFASVYQKHKPDLVAVLGDRYEIMGASLAALICGVPIAHFAGGDVTEGAYDEAIRHSITKMASLHFTTCEDSARRVRQMGEEMSSVFNVGSLSLDALKNMKLLTPSELERNLEIKLGAKNVMATFHPETKSPTVFEDIDKFILALEKISAEATVFITGSNADTFGKSYNEKLKAFASKGENRYFFDSLGHLRYLSLLNACQVAVGNSSSGIYEAPALKKWTINIGDRQKGRIFANSVKCVSFDENSIFKLTQEALIKKPADFTSPFGDGSAAKKAVAILEMITDYKALTKKSFIDLPVSIK